MREHKNKSISLVVVVISLIIVVEYFSEDHVSSFSKYYFKDKTREKDRDDVIDKNKKNAQVNRVVAADKNNDQPRKIKPSRPSLKPFMRPAQVQATDSHPFKVAPEFKGETIYADLFVVDNHYALDKDDFMPGDFEVLAQRGTFLIIKSDYPPAHALPIVMNEGSRYPGILTGVVTLKFYNYNLGVDELYKSGFEITQEYEHLNTAFIKVQGGKRAQEAFQYFQNHSNVETVELEILKGLRGHK
ncbi:MAG: hypothetical protein CME62_04110 [Halobacteriovoraceae bacterium]|nr:hypothetical protein [Halobacteriovoraceae bacterium]|tara:strand:- start:3147 stop:3878 length:732 start_codon:yes stop_codon:yes gene_type:complete